MRGLVAVALVAILAAPPAMATFGSSVFPEDTSSTSLAPSGSTGPAPATPGQPAEGLACQAAASAALPTDVLSNVNPAELDAETQSLAAFGMGVPSAPASSSQVPCGYIYPRIILTAKDFPSSPAHVSSAGMKVPLTIEFTYDPMSEGLALNDPTNPISVTFEYPKRPDWLSLSVEPKSVPIPIEPQYFHPGASDPSNPSMIYDYQTNVTLTVAVTGRPVLPDGIDIGRFLVFAKSTESGLYKPGYGIKEFKILPQGAIHQSDLGPQPTYNPVSPPPVHGGALAINLGGGATARVTLPATFNLWTPTPVNVSLPSGSAAGATASVGLVDATGHVLAFDGPSPAPFTANLTFPNAGTYYVVVATGSGLARFGREADTSIGAAVLTIPAPAAGDIFNMPRDYKLAVIGSFDRVAANSQDPAAQDERLFPFPVYEGASGADLTVALGTAGLPVDRGAANLNVAVLDPTGAVLQTGTVDPANPAKDFPVGGLPGPGLYRLRVYGSGLPDAAQFHIGLDVAYDSHPQILPDLVPWKDQPGFLGQYNATISIPNGTLPWAPARTMLKVTKADGSAAAGDATALFSVFNAEGNAVALAQNPESPLDNLSAPISFPKPGVYYVVASAFATGATDRLSPLHANDAQSATQWGRGLVAERVVVGDPSARTFSLTGPFTGAGVAEYGTSPTLLGLWALPAVTPGFGPSDIKERALSASGGTITWKTETRGEGANATVVVEAIGSGQTPGVASLTVSAYAPGSYTLDNPLASVAPLATGSRLPIPSPDALLSVLALAGAALAIGVRRR